MEDRDTRPTIVSLITDLEAMPEYSLFRSLMSFNISIFTFDKNYSDLQSFIGHVTSNPKYEQIHFVRHRDQLEEAMMHIIRLLHNYVASALSLIDHSRRVNKRLYQEEDLFPDYPTRASDDFTHDPLSQFIKCLRHYCQHYRSPNLQLTTSIASPTSPAVRTIELVKEDLISFDGWNSTAKKFLVSFEEKIDVLAIASEYRLKVLSFYKWFQLRQREIHSQEFEVMREKEGEISMRMLEMRIKSSYARNKENGPHERDEIFLSMLDSAELEELDLIPIDSDERPMRGIAIVEKLFPIPADLQAQIIEWYRDIGRNL